MKHSFSLILLKTHKCLFLLVTLLAVGVNNNSVAKDGNIFLLDQETMIREARKNSPTIAKIRSSLLSAKLDKYQYLENFQPQLEGDVSYFKTNEDPFIAFSPTVSPISNFSIGVTKDFTSGVSLGVYNILQERDYGAFGVDSRNSISLEFTMDLYKDFFGKDSKSRLSYLDYESQIATKQKEIDEEIFLVTLNRIYSSLIFNQEAINVSRDILNIYKTQEVDSKKRYKNGIADLSELRRRSSQVASKRVDIFNLVNKKENLILDLKKLLPSIASKEVRLKKYNLSYKEKYYSNVVNDIRKQEKTPMDYTHYDDIVKLVEKSYKQQKKFTKNYSDIDLEFYSTFSHFGRDGNSKGAIDDNYEAAENSYQVGLRLTAPLGRTKNNSEKIQLSIQKANFVARKRENLAKIEAYHTQTIRNLALLKKAKVYQESNSDDLKKILRLTERKYKQARIPIRDLIEDQNLYLQSLLREIDIKMVIVNQILDYMTIFTNTPFALSDG
jgi:outer membrane protein TolC